MCAKIQMRLLLIQMRHPCHANNRAKQKIRPFQHFETALFFAYPLNPTTPIQPKSPASVESASLLSLPLQDLP